MIVIRLRNGEMYQVAPNTDIIFTEYTVRDQKIQFISDMTNRMVTLCVTEVTRIHTI